MGLGRIAEDRVGKEGQGKILQNPGCQAEKFGPDHESDEKPLEDTHLLLGGVLGKKSVMNPQDEDL